MAPARLSVASFRRLAIVVAGAILSLWPTGLAAQTVPTIAVWEGGGGDWTDSHRWIIDGMPPETNNIIPGTVARPFWKVVIDGEDIDSNVFLDRGPVIPSINELEITAGDTLQIFTPLALRTDVIDGSGGRLSNSGNLFIVGNGVFIVSGSNMPPPDGGMLTLSGGGNVILDGEPVSLTMPGARIGGGGPVPRVLINEDNIISGTGQLGEGSLVIVNRRLIAADQAGKRLAIDPGGGSQLFPGDLTNDEGAVLSATNGGILELRGGRFLNAASAQIAAGANSIVELAIGAHVVGGNLTSGPFGQFRVTGNASLTSASLVESTLDILDGSSLTLAGTINAANGNIRLPIGGTRAASLLIDGAVELSGAGTITMTARPSFIAKSPLSLDSELTIGSEFRIQGTGVIGLERFSIINEGTISGNFENQTLFIDAGFDSDFTNVGTLQAFLGGTLALGGAWNLKGTEGVVAAFDSSVVVLDGVRVSGQRLGTPNNSTLGGEASQINTSQGVIRVMSNGTIFDLRNDPPVNQGLLEIPASSSLTLQSTSAGDGEMPPALANSGTILLNAATGSSFLNVSGGDVRLTGGGRVVLSDSQNNITQSVEEPQVNTLINVDNVIEGSGQIGGMRLAVDNQSGGTIRAPAGHTLFVDPPPLNPEMTQVGLRNAGMVEAAGQATLQITSSGVVNTGTIQAKGQQATTIIQGATLINRSTLQATDGGVMKLRSTTIVNSSMGTDSTIAAGSASRVELSGNTLISGGLISTASDGVVRVIDQAGIVLPLTNDGLLEVSEDAQLTVIGGPVVGGSIIGVELAILPFENQGTITLESSDLVFNGTSNLTGGGEIILSDDPGNFISGFVEGTRNTPIVFNVNNTIRGAGTIAANLLLINGTDGRIIADGAHPLRVAGSSLRLFGLAPFNEGLIRAEGSGGIELSRTNVGDEPLINVGTIEVAAGSSVQVPGTSFVQNGARLAETGETGSHPRPGTVIIDGRFDGRLDQYLGAVRGNGLLNGELVSAGKFQPGRSPGAFTVVGFFEQLPGGELEIELAGTEAGTQYDQLMVDGTAMLDGTVVVKHLDAFVAAAGAEFDVVIATALIDNGFSLALVNGGLVQPTIVDMGDGSTALRLTSIEGGRYAPVSGSWDEAGNWTEGTSPGTDDTAFIPGDPSANTIVTGPSAASTVYTLVVGIGDERFSSLTSLDLGAGTITTARGTTVRRNGRLTGDGTLGGDLYNAGIVAPGSTGGTIAVTGNYHQNETGTLAIEIGGTTPGEDYHQLTIGGTAALNGVLDVALVDSGNGPFEPRGGDTFSILTAEEEAGGFFETVLLPPIASDLTWELDYLRNSVELLASLTGDYNNNGAVEQADLDLVLLNWGTDVTFIPLQPEWTNQRPTEGFVDQEELDAVLLHWGNTSASVAAAGVPEPSGIVLGLVMSIVAVVSSIHSAHRP